MLRIRLSRGGKKKQPHYRVVVANVESKRDGRVVERIGHYNPLTNPPTFNIDESRALYWVSVGAQPSDAVKLLLEKQGTYKRLQRLRAGESLEALVAEYEGVDLAVETPPAKPAKAIKKPAVEESVATAPVESEVEAVTEAIPAVEDTEAIEAMEAAETVEAEEADEAVEMEEAAEAVEAVEETVAEAEVEAEATAGEEPEETAAELEEIAEDEPADDEPEDEAEEEEEETE